MLRRRPLDEIKESLLREQKSDGDINKLKMIFKENPFLRQIPPSQRPEFCSAMKLHILAPLEVFLTDKMKKPDLYIILDGKVFIRNKAKEETLLESYDIFGYTQPFNGVKWAPSRVTARDSVSLISIPRVPLKKAMEKVRKFQDSTRLLEFLVKTVPGVKQLGQAGKEKVLSFFEKCQFKSGETVLKEGEKAGYAYIIEEGQCKIVGSQNPLKRPGSAPPRGLISKTTSCYNLGVVMPGEWVGEDSILTNKPLDFSVIAFTNIQTLRISREKFLESLTRDTQNALKENLANKIRWREDRKQKISQAIVKTVIDEEGKAEVSAYEDTEKNYPKASKLALVNIRKQEQEKYDNLEKKKQMQEIENTDGLTLNVSKIQSIRASRPQTGKIRPASAVTDKQSRYCGPSSSSKNVFFSQPLYNKSLEEPYAEQGAKNLQFTQNSKIQLYSAYTIGGNLVPTMVIRPQSSKPKPQPVVAVHEDKYVPISANTFAQKVRMGRPPSPNPAEVWAKKKGVDLNRFSVLNSELY